MQRWTDLLPEAGTIERMGERQKIILHRIEQLKDEESRLRKEYHQNEAALYEQALTQWTPQEIELAKRQAEQIS